MFSRQTGEICSLTMGCRFSKNVLFCFSVAKAETWETGILGFEWRNTCADNSMSPRCRVQLRIFSRPIYPRVHFCQNLWKLWISSTHVFLSGWKGCGDTNFHSQPVKENPSGGLTGRMVGWHHLFKRLENSQLTSVSLSLANDMT